jgi:signal transduction histidine kinase
MKLAPNLRLMTRFAVASLFAFVTIGVVLAFVVSNQIRERQEAAAKLHAVFIVDSVLRFELNQADLQEPVDPQSPRFAQLLAFMRSRLLHQPVVRLKIWRSDGTILMSDEPRLVGQNFGVDDELEEAFEGTTEAGVSNLTERENYLERGPYSKLYATYVPLYVGSRAESGTPDAVAEVYTDYAGIAAEVEQLFQTLVITLCAGLFALYLLLFPIIRQVARTLSAQNVKLEEQAGSLRGLLEREQQTTSELRELNRLKDDFVAVASHEVRTPLTSIIGYAKTLQRPEFSDDPSARAEFLAAIERQGDRLHRLVGNLLAASHMEEDRRRLSVSPVSLPEVVDDVLSGLGPRARRVRRFMPSDLPYVVTDRQRLELILANLLDNALKFSPEGTPCDVGARRVQDAVELWVSDRGIGIEGEHLDLIFDRFYQVDSSVTRRYGGVGLGLNLVHELAHSLGGTIGVVSAPGSGSTFSVRLPLGLPAADGGRPATVGDQETSDAATASSVGAGDRGGVGA